jgi:flagellar biosynthesis GTPase FlhF
MLARTPETADELNYWPANSSVEAAYQVLKLAQGAPRREIKRAYRRLALTVHPDRKGASDDGAEFRQLQAAYERLMTHTQFDDQLEELDAELEAAREAEERELNELEMKRFERELRENALADARKQRERRQAEDAEDQCEDEERARRRKDRRREDDIRWLENASHDYKRYWEVRGRLVTYNDLHYHITRLVQDDEMQGGPPPAVMLHRPNKPDLLCYRIWYETCWKSQDNTVVIEQRTGPYGEKLWMMVEQQCDPLRRTWWCQHYWLRGCRYPFNQAWCGRGLYKWGFWADAPAGRMSLLNSRPVRSRELRQIREKQAAETKKAKKAAADIAAKIAEQKAEEQLRAEEEQEESERQRVLGKRKEKERHLAEKQKEVEEQRRQAAEVEERKQQMAQARCCGAAPTLLPRTHRHC